MPNLKTDRTAGMARGAAALNVRRLMYQSLIWAAHLGDHARRLRTALDAEDLERAADPLVDRVRGNSQLDRDLLGRKVLVDEQEGVELSLAQPRDARDAGRIRLPLGRRVGAPLFAVVCEITLHQHEWPFTAKDEITQKRRHSSDNNIGYSIACSPGEGRFSAEVAPFWSSFGG